MKAYLTGCDLITDDGDLKEDLKLPTDEELRKELLNLWVNNQEEKVLFTILSACNSEKIISGRVKKEWFVYFFNAGKWWNIILL